MLTAQQHKAYQFIRKYLSDRGHAPTLLEIGAGIGVQSKGSVHRLVQELLKKGYVLKEATGWRSLRVVVRDDAFILPLLGRIAAGVPIEAIPGEDSINLVDFLIGPKRFALRVIGDSMVGAGILSGDTVVVEQTSVASDGDIVVALIDNDQTTLKRLKKGRDATVTLLAENPAIPAMTFAAHRVLIQGVVVAQLRSYR